MKRKLISIFLASVMLLSLSACGSSEVIRKLDAIEDRLDRVEESLENRYEKVVAPEAAPKAEFSLSEQEALEIALEHAGLDEAQIELPHVHLDRDDRRSEYEVDFYHGGYEYDYEIDAESGEIISVDKDRH